MQNLTNLLLEMNRLTGCIIYCCLEHTETTDPASLPESAHRQPTRGYYISAELHLSQNNLTGPLPATYGQLANLTKLWLHQNRFKYSSIPKLYNNALRGPLPQCICTMRNVLNIDISNNQIAGSIPSCIGNMPVLFEMHFSRNNMTGTIPESVGNLSTFLQTFDISHNSFYGALPTSLNSFRVIQNFIINDNHFTSVSGLGMFFVRLYINRLFGGLVQWTITHGDVPFLYTSRTYAMPHVDHTEKQPY